MYLYIHIYIYAYMCIYLFTSVSLSLSVHKQICKTIYRESYNVYIRKQHLYLSVGPSHGFAGADDYFHHKPATRSELVT